MPSPSTDELIVTQADRDRAADLRELVTREGETAEDTYDAAHAIRSGSADSHAFVQAFARHRLSALQPPSGGDEVEKLIADVRCWIGAGDGPAGPTGLDRLFGRIIAALSSQATRVAEQEQEQ